MKRIPTAARRALIIAMILNFAGALPGAEGATGASGPENDSLTGLVGVTVRYKNGNTLEGLLVSMDDEAIMLDVGGGMIVMSRRYVESVEFKPNRHVEFKEREAATDPGDARALGRALPAGGRERTSMKLSTKD